MKKGRKKLNTLAMMQLPSMVYGVAAANIDVIQVMDFVAASIRITSAKLVTSLTSAVAFVQVSSAC